MTERPSVEELFSKFVPDDYKLFTGLKAQPEFQCQLSVGVLHSTIGHLNFSTTEFLPHISAEIITNKDTALTHVRLHGRYVAFTYFIHQPPNTKREYRFQPDGQYVVVTEETVQKGE